MKFVLDFGTQVDMLNRDELREALAEDARIRAVVAGVKPVRYWANSGTIGAVASFTTPVLVAQGYVWAVMNIGVEESAGNNITIYLYNQSGTAGNNRVVATLPSGGGTRSAQLSKGQLMLNGGDYLTVTAAAGTLSSVFIQAIQVPSERVGELLL